MRARDKIVVDGSGTHYFLDYNEVSEEEYRKIYPMPANDGGAFGTSSSAAWPIRSDGAAVHPDQREEAMADAKKKGVDTYFDRLGRPEFTSQQHQRKYLRAYGMHNNDDNS